MPRDGVGGIFNNELEDSLDTAHEFAEGREDSICTDVTTHHIEGIAREGGIPFHVPLISQITKDGTLWQGGCINGTSLQGRFKHVISLYPWEQFNPGNDLDSFTAVRLHDTNTVPDEEQLYHLARW